MSAINYIKQLEDSDTNIVFTFGYTGSGKSTLLIALYEYLYLNHRIDLNTSGNKDGVHYIMRCADNLRGKEKKLPPITTTNTIKEIDWIYEMHNKESIFTFLDMPGEDLKLVDPTVKDVNKQYSDGSLKDEITKYLVNKKLSIILLCIIDYEEVVRDNQLISAFLHFVKSYNYKFLGAAVVVTKWDKNNDINQDVTSFVKTEAKQTYLQLDTIVDKPQYFHFSIGEVNKTDKERLDFLNLSYCKPLLEWLHKVSINKPDKVDEENEKNILSFLSFCFNQVMSFISR